MNGSSGGKTWNCPALNDEGNKQKVLACGKPKRIIDKSTGHVKIDPDGHTLHGIMLCVVSLSKQFRSGC